ncbi:respiratory burst oxidase homolog protein A-like [Pistacia vera]|uniref:respiratory burst oxidase homolog protein A-like n=1 Tax=Pistacia vera TaxID=55513 RepID=UPI001262F326|nr:respiratory burst oxidase homolog protein A-like [Pistacia vera]
MHAELEAEREHYDDDHSALSTSSSFSSTSSSCSVPFSFSPALTAGPPWRHVEPNGDQDHYSSVAGFGVTGLTFTELDWTTVEHRFDRLASTRNVPEPVVKWSDFGYCVGIQRSPEISNEILKALRGRRECKVDITKKELHRYWLRMTDPSINYRIQLFFDMIDRNMDGRITEVDIKQTILMSATANKLSVTHEEAEEHAGLVMEALDTHHHNQGYLQAPQLESLFELSMPQGSSYASNVQHQNGLYQEPISRAEIMFRSYWRRGWIILFWLMICVALFAWKFIQYSHRTAFQVMGYCLSTAKGAAETLKFNMAIILLPVCRNSITWLRKNRRISSVIPFNDNINFHKLIAGGIVVGVILHGGTHLACDFPRISGSDSSIFRQTIAASFGYHQPSYIQILATTEVATGIAMVVLMSIAFSLATKWPRRQSPSLPRSVRQVTGYNTFWYSHHLFIFVYALLIVHSMFLFLTSNVTEKTTWIYIAIPVLLYAGERIFRAVRSRFYEIEVLKVSFYPGKVLSLKLNKPKGFNHKGGMYTFLQCPQISPFEWHPFSLTSGPADDHLSVHIRALGDWSYQLYSLFQEAVLTGAKELPKIYIDGPYGAASQDYIKYDIVILIGLGIGATPFISILKDIANGLQNTQLDQVCSSQKGPLKAYLYWVTREQSSFDWFRDIMKEISKPNLKQSVIEIHNFLTSIYQEGNVRSALISIIQALYYRKTGIDIVSRTPVRTHFARPNWLNVFSKLARKHRGARIGVFYCGPSGLARELARLCTKFSTKTNTRFVFHKENY